MSKLRYNTIASSDLSSVAQVEGNAGALCTMSTREYLAWSGRLFRICVNSTTGLISMSANSSYNLNIITGAKKVVIMDVSVKAQGTAMALMLYYGCSFSSNGFVVSSSGNSQYICCNVDHTSSVAPLSSVYHNAGVSAYGTSMYNGHLTLSASTSGMWSQLHPYGLSPLAVLKPNYKYTITVSNGAGTSMFYGIMVDFTEI